MTNQNPDGPKRTWRESLTVIARHQINKSRFELIEKIIGGWVIVLGVAAAIAKFYDRNTSFITLTVAGGIAALIGLFFWVWHRHLKNRLIYWRIVLPMLVVHLLLLGWGIVFVTENSVKPHPPTLLTLWGTDFLGHGVYTEIGHSFYPSDEDPQLRYYYRLVQELSQQSKFLMLYIPEPKFQKEITSWVAQHLDAYLTPYQYVSGKADGESYPVDNLHLKFTGIIYIYYEGILSPEDTVAIRKTFADVGVTAQFRGTEYADDIGNGVVSGKLHQPADIEIRNGVPCRVMPRKTPGAVRTGDQFKVPVGEDFSEAPLIGLPNRCLKD
ncbi:MAG: hypothetical protein J0I19_02570 [Alphaproteobacteria bacterium]|nr:hypothetical protein [Alphaproteobacteria bacterium]